MPEKMRALFHGATDEQGLAREWLGQEPPSEPGQPDTPPVPARHLTQEEYDALTPRNKERIREAKNARGEPLYVVRTEAEMRERPASGASPASSAAPKADKTEKEGGE